MSLWFKEILRRKLFTDPFSSNKQHLSYDGCLEVGRDIIRTVLRWIEIKEHNELVRLQQIVACCTEMVWYVLKQTSRSFMTIFIHHNHANSMGIGHDCLSKE